MDNRRSGGGFTLLETLVALMISAVLLTQAAPAWNTLIQAMRVRTVVSALERSLRLIRQEAILRQMPARLCPSRDLVFCGGDWADGWLAFVDQTGDMFRDTDDPLLAAHEPVHGVTFRYNRGGLISTNSRGQLSQNGTMRICTPGADGDNIELIMVRSGRLRLASTENQCQP